MADLRSADRTVDEWPAPALRRRIVGAGRVRRAALARRTALAAAVTADSTTVELAGVEAALARLRGDENHGSVRATTLNLVVMCQDDESADRTDAVLDAIGGSRP